MSGYGGGAEKYGKAGLRSGADFSPALFMQIKICDFTIRIFPCILTYIDNRYMMMTEYIDYLYIVRYIVCVLRRKDMQKDI